MLEQTYLYLLEKAVAISLLAFNKTQSNPLVACIIIEEFQDGSFEIISEGYHQEFGKKHAEIEALSKINTKFLEDASRNFTLIVSLEPCSHVGKTGSCALKIIEYPSIKKVVFACFDENPKVSGKGIQILKNNNIEAIQIKKAEEWVKKYYFSFFKKLSLINRPFISLKYASTLNQFLGHSQKRIMITHQNAIWYSYFIRQYFQALLVGSRTIWIDSPQLRMKNTSVDLLRVVWDPHASIEHHLQHPFLKMPATTLWFTHKPLVSFQNPNPLFLKIIPVQHIHDLLTYLYQMGISQLLVEGGAHTLNMFFELNLWDEMIHIQNQKNSPELNNENGVAWNRNEIPENTEYSSFYIGPEDQVHLFRKKN